MARDSLLADLLRPQAATPADGFLARLRGAALDRANALAVPTTRDEDWRFTDLAPLRKLAFQQVASGHAVAAAQLQARNLDNAVARLVFVDGVLVPALSSAGSSAKGIDVMGLDEALQAHGTLLEQHLGRHALVDDAVFTAVNTSLLREAAVVVARAGQGSDDPVHLLFVATGRSVPHAVHPRCLVVAERGSRCCVVEEYLTHGEGTHLTNPVTEIVLGASAVVRHVRLQDEGASAYHIGRCVVSQQRDSEYASVSVTFGARLSRYDLDVRQEGEGTRSSIDGLAVIDGRQHADTHTCMDHGRPHGRSTQLHKCVVGGGAHAVFNGKILVRRDAQLTDSTQSSRNLLVSPRARVDTKPQLEIFADDVKCAHGATVGQLEADELFYLRSRGLSEAAARALLTSAFAAEVIGRIPVASLRARLAPAVSTEPRIAQ